MSSETGTITIMLSLFVAMILAVFHLPEWSPDWLAWFRPSWVVLVMLYWVMELPHRVGMVRAWLLGLCLDVLLGEPMGVNAFCLAALTFVTWSIYERLRMYAVVQQAVFVFGAVLCIELLKMLLWMQFLNADFHMTFLWVAMASALVWPLVYLVLRRSSKSTGF
ncbi:MAG: rod shape-determining protein MreD [Pseudomonadales bacterium]|nr:rod shape-determining protein MreD [Pseudomonadales bacterium]